MRLVHIIKDEDFDELYTGFVAEKKNDVMMDDPENPQGMMDDPDNPGDQIPDPSQPAGRIKKITPKEHLQNQIDTFLNVTRNKGNAKLRRIADAKDRKAIVFDHE